MNLIEINAIDIPDAWFSCIYSILDNGNKYVIQHGSYVGQTRLEFDWITIYIKNPYAEPYDLMLPQIPLHLNIPNPVERGYIEQYLPYLMTGEKKEDEAYTYGERLSKFLLDTYVYKNTWRIDLKHVIDEIDSLKDPIVENISTGKITSGTYVRKKIINQIELMIWTYKNKGYRNNQMCLQVAQPSDILLKDPPCLRHIDTSVRDGKLHFFPYFRSWDLWGGFPSNLAGIAVLQKYMADEIGIEAGPIIASSKGLHIYEYVEELAKIRTNKG